jgi:uncharacterized protein (TIGR03503 family)
MIFLYKKFYLIIIVPLFIFFSNVNVQAKNTIKTVDIRLLIDISGSMKKNDPNNLRIPAIQLVSNLLPKKTRAGIWSFGQHVNNLVKVAPVSQKWQKRATQMAKKINSSGLYTNIGQALEQSTQSWSSPNPTEKRSLILLTDGMVDIGKDPKKNKKERNRILKKILPQLKLMGVAIHTIALSKHADHELLKTLSKSTDGWYNAVNNADELQKLFLRLFEQSIGRESLPIKANIFSVDKSIDEMTVLVFRRPSSNPTRLISPSNQSIHSQSTHSGLRWFSSRGYDLITVQNPDVGNWKIIAEVDPDNRVMVLSNLSLQVSPLPNNLLLGEAIHYNVQFVDKGIPITNVDFLNLMEVKLIQEKEENKQVMGMFFDRQTHEFKQTFYTGDFVGQLRLTLQVMSPTFEREKHHAINIYSSPIATEIILSKDNREPHELHLTIRKNLVHEKELHIRAIITMPDGKKLYKTIDHEKKLLIDADINGGKYQVHLIIHGNSLLNRPFKVTPKPIIFTAQKLEEPIHKKKEKHSNDEKVIPSKTLAPILTEAPKTLIKANKTLQKIIISESRPSKTHSNKEERSLLEWVYIGLGGNAVLIFVGFFVRRFLKRNNQQKNDTLINELEDNDDE